MLKLAGPIPIHELEQLLEQRCHQLDRLNMQLDQLQQQSIQHVHNNINNVNPSPAIMHP